MPVICVIWRPGLSLASLTPLRAPSAYDLWLDQRLETGEDVSWLAEHNLFTATTICSLFGGVLLRDQLPEPTDPAECRLLLR